MSFDKKLLSDFATVISGYAFKSEWFGTGNNKVIRIGDLQDNLIQIDAALTVDSAQHKISSNFRIKNKDILMALSGATVGKTAVASEHDAGAYINQRVAIIRAKDEITADYLKFFFSGEFLEDLLSKAGGAAQPNLSPKQLLLMEIPLPALVEQRRIASILDKADELRQKRRQAIAKLDQLLQATFIDMFGDPKINPYGLTIRKLSEFYVDSKKGTKCGPFGSALKRHEYVDEGVPVWSMDVITLGGEFIDNPSLWVTSEKFKELESYSVEQGDVIISRAGTVGKMGVVHSQYEKSLISTNLIRLRFGKNLLPEYFVALMTYCKHRLSRLQTGADGAFTHMNTGILDNLEFPYPLIDKQKQFVDFLYMVNNKKQIYLESSKRIDDLFASLQNQAFNGTL